MSGIEEIEARWAKATPESFIRATGSGAAPGNQRWSVVFPRPVPWDPENGGCDFWATPAYILDSVTEDVAALLAVARAGREVESALDEMWDKQWDADLDSAYAQALGRVGIARNSHRAALEALDGPGISEEGR